MQTLVTFRARLGVQKARCFGRRKIIIRTDTIGLRAGQRSGPNNLDDYNRAFALYSAWALIISTITIGPVLLHGHQRSLPVAL